MAEQQTAKPVSLRRACDMCTRRKNKCSRELPCSVCVKTGSRCEYSTALKRGRRPKVLGRTEGMDGAPVNNAATPASSATASAQIVPLSERQSASRPLQIASTGSADAPADTSPLAAAAGKSPSSVLQLISKSGPHMVSFQALIEASSISQPSDNHTPLTASTPLFDGALPTGQQQGLQPLRELSKEDTMGVLAYPTEVSDNQPHQTFTQQVSEGPSSPEWTRREEELYRIYWAIVHPLWPLIFRPAVDERIIRQQRPLLHHAMMALACERAEINTEHDTFDYKSFGDLHAQQFRNMFDYNTHVPRVATIQALLLMSFREVQKDAGLPGWNYLGLAIRYATTLSLHLKSRNNLPEAPEEQEACRVIWAAYVAEQWSSLALGKPCSIRAINISRPLPSVMESDEYGFWMTDARGLMPMHIEQAFQGVRSRTMSNFRTWVLLMQILEEIIAFCLHGVSMAETERREDLVKLDRKLQQWLDDRPSEFGDMRNTESVSRNPPHIIDICLRYHTCVIILYRPFIADPAPSHRRDHPDASAFEVCISAADAIISLFTKYEGIVGSLKRASAAFVFMLLQAGLVYIAAFASDDLAVSKLGGMQLYQCLKWLKKMAYSYGSASKFVDFLQSWAVRLRLNTGRDSLRSREATPVTIVPQQANPDVGVPQPWSLKGERLDFPAVTYAPPPDQESDFSWLFDGDLMPDLHSNLLQNLPTDMPDFAQWLNLPVDYDSDLFASTLT